MTRQKLGWRLAAAMAPALLLAPVSAAAVGLDKAACDLLKTQEAAFVKDGVKSDFEKGIEAVPADVPADRLETIKRFIAVEEDLKFRCRHGPVPIGDDDGGAVETLLPEPGAAKKPHSAEAGHDGEVKKPQPKAKPKPVAAKAQGTGDMGSSDDAPAKPKSQPQVKAKPKPKPKPAENGDEE